jgi:hypothetical protein
MAVKTKREIILDMLTKLKIEMKEYDANKLLDRFLPETLDITELMYFILNIFTDEIDETINNLFEIYNVSTKDDNKVKEILKIFIVNFQNIIKMQI